jgi:hypothetical protein
VGSRIPIVNFPGEELRPVTWVPDSKEVHPLAFGAQTWVWK